MKATFTGLLSRCYSTGRGIDQQIGDATVRNPFNLDYQTDEDLEASRRALLLRLLVVVGIMALAVNGVTAFYRGNKILAVVDMVMIPVFLFYLLLSFKRRHLDTCSIVGTTTLGVLTLFLAYFGGTEMSAVIWTITFPIIALNLLGPRRGIVFSIIHLAILMSLFAFGKIISMPVSYSFFWSSRILFAYTTVFLITLIAEKLRATIQRKLLNTGEQLEQTLREREKLIAELTDTINEVKTLRGIIPICAHCKKIRSDKGYWEQVEQYVQDRSEAQFSHALCPDCAKDLYPDQLSQA
jgi:hypothetical protein